MGIVWGLDGWLSRGYDRDMLYEMREARVLYGADGKPKDKGASKDDPDKEIRAYCKEHDLDPKDPSSYALAIAETLSEDYEKEELPRASTGKSFVSDRK